LVSRRFPHYVLLASALGAGCAVVGLLLSAVLDLPSGPAVVVVQLAGFLAALALAPRSQGSGA
jgi:zinc/manganese transport system permease protein